MRETVPDGILDQADDIQVVDLSPEDLIKRLREGKVYVPQQAERAIRHYFSSGNLTALRELALRRTAQRVDEQLLSHMRAHAIPGPWAAGDRVLVCVSEAPSTAGLIRYAKRLADRLQVPWTAVYVETARTQRLTDVERDRIADHLRLAERLGASTITLPGRNVADSSVAEEPMVCMTLRWRELDSNFQFRATLGSLAGLRDAQSEQRTCRIGARFDSLQERGGFARRMPSRLSSSLRSACKASP